MSDATAEDRTAASPRPLAEPIEALDVPHPALPAALDGLTVLHLSDFHIRRYAPGSAKIQRLARALEGVEADVIAITGDLMDEPGQEKAAIQTLRLLMPCMHARSGIFGVFGNHDTPQFQRRAAVELPEIRWLGTETVDISIHGTPFRVIGLSWPEDPLSAVLASATLPLSPLPFTLTLAHHAGCLLACADLGLPLVIAGHTHAGQVRLSAHLAPHTSSDIPSHLATGILRLRSTLACISRGIGEGVIEHLRINCPWQIPLYRLRHAELPPVPRGGSTETVTQVRAW